MAAKKPAAARRPPRRNGGVTAAHSQAEVPAQRREVERLLGELDDYASRFSFVRSARAHPHYARLLAIGAAVIPVALGAMQEDPSMLLMALMADLVGDDAPPTSAETLDEAGEEWVQWGVARGYLK